MTATELADLLKRYKGDRNGFISAYLQKDNTAKRSDVGNLYDTTYPNTGGSGSGAKTPTGEPNLLEAGLGKIVDLIKTQESGQGFKSLKEEMKTIDNLYGLFFDTNTKKALSFKNIAGNLLSSAIDGVNQYYSEQTALLERINQRTGLTGQLSRDFREEITKAQPRLLQLGISFDELSDSAARLVEQSGRFNLINQQTFERAGLVAKAYVGTLQDLVGMYPEFEKVGIGAADAQEKIADAGKRSLELGLRSQTVTTELGKNLGKLNEYGFRNGVRGLEEMVRKTVEFRMNMDNVYQIAEKVFDPDKAIELSANLQVLGGAIGDFNDPLKLMYMATNNVEGLQDALIGAAGGLATYNAEQGRFEITGVNLRRAKAMASELGMSLGDLSKSAIAAAERASASGDLLAQGLKLDDDQQRFITNLAQMKGGKMMIEIQSEKLQNMFGKSEVALQDLDQNQAELLLKYQDEFKKLSDNEIVRNQATSIANIEKDVNFLIATMRAQAGRTGQAIYDRTAEAIGYDLKTLAQDSFDMVKKGALKITDLSKGAQEFIREIGYTNKDLKGMVTPPSSNNVMTPEKQREIEEQKKKNETPTTRTGVISQQDLVSAFSTAFTQTKYSSPNNTNNMYNIELSNPNGYV
jgi:hypothetical protein